MRLLVVAARPFRPGGKGDQVRLAQVVDALAAKHAVTILQPLAEPCATPAAATTVDSVRLTLAERATGALIASLLGRPAQTGWCAPPRFVRRVREHALSHDAVLYVTSRVFVPDAGPAVAVDHVDALSENTLRRATSYKLRALRFLWRAEANRLRRWERRAAMASTVQLVTSPSDADALPREPVPIIVPIGVDLDRTPPPTCGERDIDVIFTGDMRYPPNRDAAAWLAADILPRLLERRPGVRAVFAGRGADTLPSYAGVEVVSDVPDLGAWLTRAKIAVAPLRIGTGVPNKVLEAACAGAAIVLTASANSGLGLSDAAAGVADDAEPLADEIARLLERPSLRLERRARLASELQRFSLPTVTARYAASLDALEGSK